ncbi:SDR family NAD(P)-dependent oxidoreductase [Parabacteroides faecis]|uniref:SDR family NAD(P)-dependent oxidoreductase n=1 Tax=Parabacteroides faecis TaxID=1217282 RepID=UPI003522188B
MKNIAIILAGGIGSRLNAGIPKQFLKVAGMTVIEHTISVFQHHPLIDEIAVVANEAYHVKIQEYVIKNEFTKVRKVLMSGNERHFSSLSAIKAYEFEGECKLIFHDAVRPLLNASIITQVIEALDKYGAVDVAIPSADTIIEVNENNIITKIPQRKKLRRGQTPQGFRLSVIKDAYEVALKDPAFVTTDDCGVVLKYLPSQSIFVVSGEDVNMKLTYKEDFYLIEKLFQLKTMNFPDHSFHDSEREKIRGKKIVIFGASSGIGLDLMHLCKDCGADVFGFSRSLNNVDVTNVISVRNALDTVARQVGSIDCVVDTASVLYKEPLAHMNYEQIEEAININYKGMVNVAKEAFPYLEKSRGQLVFYTSSSYTRGRMSYSIYSSTKCATVNFVQALAEEWGGFGIRVNCVSPERTKTPMRVKNFGIEPDDTLLKSVDVAVVTVKLLISDLTGQVIDVKLKSI